MEFWRMEHLVAIILFRCEKQHDKEARTMTHMRVVPSVNSIIAYCLHHQSHTRSQVSTP